MVLNEGRELMNIRSSAQTVMCQMFLKKQGKAVKLNVQERWNPLFIQNLFFPKVAIGCVQVVMISVYQPPRTQLSITSNRSGNKFQPPAPPK